ncbi:MAG: VWA domain-containing protein [bacterium]|nr:VWA domain-containing protein [bacterium]
MKKICYIILILFIIPVFAYEVYTPNDYQYEKNGDKLLFVLDFSNSMTEYLEHKTKVNQVKNAMQKILPQISSDTKVGVRVYGHTCNLVAYNACRSSELIVPLAENNAPQIIHAISKLRPKGMTPITYSLKQAVKKDLDGFDGTKHIILLTDGGENCDESPCDYSIELVKKRRDIKIDVIAFNVNDNDDLAQLKCTADVTGGHFIEADTNAQLMNSMQDLIVPHKSVEALIYGKN